MRGLGDLNRPFFAHHDFTGERHGRCASRAVVNPDVPRCHGQSNRFALLGRRDRHHRIDVVVIPGKSIQLVGKTSRDTEQVIAGRYHVRSGGQGPGDHNRPCLALGWGTRQTQHGLSGHGVIYSDVPRCSRGRDHGNRLGRVGRRDRYHITGGRGTITVECCQPVDKTRRNIGDVVTFSYHVRRGQGLFDLDLPLLVFQNRPRQTQHGLPGRGIIHSDIPRCSRGGRNGNRLTCIISEHHHGIDNRAILVQSIQLGGKTGRNIGNFIVLSHLVPGFRQGPSDFNRPFFGKGRNRSVQTTLVFGHPPIIGGVIVLIIEILGPIVLLVAVGIDKRFGRIVTAIVVSVDKRLTRIVLLVTV